MARFGEDDYTNMSNMRQKDLVLAVNEFCYVLNKTNGAIKSHVGPMTVTISQQETLVIFNSKTKKFEEINDFERAKQLFVSAPMGWYIVLKNPTSDGIHPEAGKPNSTPNTLTIGMKVNISGPANFALYPGQMAKVIRGHRLRSNQYLLARVYDAEAATANASSATVVNEKGEEVKIDTKYAAGQLLIIQGTEVSFYIPPTGIEVIPQTPYGDDYIREAVTLERLEYAILKDEDGEKRYVHGPSVVFPKPTETFMITEKGSVIFRALELSPISGIYVKVIAEYDEEYIGKAGTKLKKHHPVGEELFITGNDQMIYYPRPEHAMIQYDGKYMHHAIAIPEGEGRYILNRLTGEIKTIKGPKMYLPDPRTEVVVKRQLSRSECELYYPGNKDVIAYNQGLGERQMERLANSGKADKVTNMLNSAYSTMGQEKTLAIFEATSQISRGVSYTKPRTITLDTKYDGVVTINVWTSYAINVVSKTGKREVVIGPATRLLNYDETLEKVELSTGKPKNTDNLISTVYLRINNNKVTDIIAAQTKDFVNVEIKLSYDLNFLEKYKDRWFSANNYVKLLCDKMSSLIKREVKRFTIEEFYSNSTDIIRNIVLNLDHEKADGDTTPDGRLFTENGMFVYDCEVLKINIERGVASMLEEHQNRIVKSTLDLSEANKNAENIRKLAEYEKEQIKLKNDNAAYQEKLRQEQRLISLANEAEVAAKRRAEEEARTQASKDLQPILDAIQAAELERKKKESDAKIEREKAEAAIERSKQQAYAATVVKIMESVSPELVAALESNANADMLAAVSKSIAPYAMAKGESVADFTDKLLRGTTLEGVLKNIGNND